MPLFDVTVEFEGPGTDAEAFLDRIDAGIPGDIRDQGITVGVDGDRRHGIFRVLGHSADHAAERIAAALRTATPDHPVVRVRHGRFPGEADIRPGEDRFDPERAGVVEITDGPTWTPPDAELGDRLLVSAVVIAAERQAYLVQDDGAIALVAEGSFWRAAGVLRATVGVMLACEHAARPHRPAKRAALTELDQLLQTVIDPGQRHGTTFPSRSQADTLTNHGHDPARVAHILGLEIEAARDHARTLGLRLSIGGAALNRSPRQIDVRTDTAVRFVSSIIGLHV